MNEKVAFFKLDDQAEAPVRRTSAPAPVARMAAKPAKKEAPPVRKAASGRQAGAGQSAACRLNSPPPWRRTRTGRDSSFGSASIDLVRGVKRIRSGGPQATRAINLAPQVWAGSALDRGGSAIKCAACVVLRNSAKSLVESLAPAVVITGCKFSWLIVIAVIMGLASLEGADLDLRRTQSACRSVRACMLPIF
jgi:hypothetical protein